MRNEKLFGWIKDIEEKDKKQILKMLGIMN